MVLDIILRPPNGFKVDAFKTKLIDFMEKEFNGYIEYNITISSIGTLNKNKTEMYISRDEIITYIKSKKDYSFSVREIIDLFLGQDAWDILSHNDFATTRMKLDRIRKHIAETEIGEWEYTMLSNHEKMYIFKPMNTKQPIPMM